jgi:tetratricopeptide (TPR) repeat protein
MILKCKMCGGDIDFTPGATYGTCAYCGSVSTIPRAEDEGKLNLYNRANHFRRQGEFDKALAAYEKLLELDDTDAEAHWGTAISRYGIEYVEDPASGQRIPTCHRVQVASILADADYLAAVEHAPDEESKRIYQAEAQRIAEIQKGILAISANEQPYDVFICYKETDDNGQRTHDSQWAQDVYYGLTELGYKVFFSRITLEDKLGQQYEPYIFAALNSAKVMVVIGSKPEYFNAVWVKNEWSRYLALMAKDRKRLLIPCYRGMDPYDLPEELSVLQSQDMGKIGFMKDLLRGVKKILDADKKAEQPKAVQQVMQTVPATIAASPGVSSLMDRTYLFMEDADFDSAADYLNRVLDIDPKFAPAYAAKVCVAFRIRKEPGLADTTFLYEDNADWQKAIRFANAQQKAIYEGYIAKVRERVAVQIRNYAYDCAVEMAVNPKADRNQLDNELSAYKTSCNRSNGNRADGNRRQNSQLYENAFKQAVRTNEPGAMSEQGLKTAAAMFDALKDSEAAECAKQCRAMAEQVIYTNAVTAYSSSRNNPTGLEQAAAVFLSVPQYKDAKAQAQKCLDEAEAIRDDLYNKAVSAMKEAGEESYKWEVARKKLSAQELNDYRDVAQLFVQAAKRYNECLAVEQEARRQRGEIARRKVEAETVRKKRNTILGVIVTVMVIAAFILVTKFIVPGN